MTSQTRFSETKRNLGILGRLRKTNAQAQLSPTEWPRHTPNRLNPRPLESLRSRLRLFLFNLQPELAPDAPGSFILSRSLDLSLPERSSYDVSFEHRTA